MSRQAVIKTDIEVKNMDILKEAIQLAVEELGGVLASTVRYYAGEAIGININGVSMGVIVQDGKLQFVGDDYHLSMDAAKKLMKLIKQKYSARALQKVLIKFGFTTQVQQSESIIVRGVKA